MKESEIGYQMAFSRAELKRVIKEYPAKEVKKGLESLYKKVEKHLSEDESLLQVSIFFARFILSPAKFNFTLPVFRLFGEQCRRNLLFSTNPSKA